MSNKLSCTSRYFHCNTENPLFFLSCGQLLSPSGFIHHRRSFDVNVLIMVTEGTLFITAHDTPFTLGAGQYIFLKAGEEHFGHRASEGKLSYLWTHFKSDDDFAAVNDLQTGTYFFPETSHLSNTGRTAQLFHQLMDLSLEEKLYSRDMLNYSLSLLLMEITQDFCQKNGKNDELPMMVVTAKEWINNHYYKPFSLAELSEAVGYSEDYLSSNFKKSIGESIIRYTNNIRIRAAKTLLSNYDVSIKEAAYSCGFLDEKYFMKVFKQIEGTTPLEYKKSFSRKNLN